MPTRRSIDDDAPLRRREGADGAIPKDRRKRKGKKKPKVPILWFVVLGIAAVSVVGIGAVVLSRSKTHREQEAAGGANAANRQSGSGPSASVGVDLVLNGSFEDGPEPDPAGPGFTMLEAGSTVIPGWTVTRGSVDYIGPYWQHADGRRSIDLNGSEPGAIAQTIRTRPGRKYRVSFSLAGNACGGDGPAVKRAVVTAAGGRAEFSFDTTERSYEDMGWIVLKWEFTAVAAETTVEFASATDTPAACGPALDRVSVVEIVN